MTEADEPPVVAERRGRLGTITLNRPRSINALDNEMVGLVTRALESWVHDDDVATVLVRGAGDRGLCAGGDIVGLYRAVTGRDVESAGRFLRDEYRMNALIASYPKPYVAFMDGIVLGGGVGISAHGSLRIVTERTRLGMPETAIGFAPDVGGTRLLARAPGQLGTHAALTGSMLSGADAIAMGLADHWVPSEHLEVLATALETDPADAAVAAVAQEPPPSAIMRAALWIDAAYGGDDLGAILVRLASGDDDARAAAETLAGRSPTALAVTLRSLRIARSEATLEEALRREYRVSMHLFAMPDFAEGVRAQVVDKDRSPLWHPVDIADVSESAVAAAFAPVDLEPGVPVR